MSGVLAEGAEKGWKNYDDFAAGQETNRLPNTDHWVGKELSIKLENHKTLKLSFEREKVKWDYNGETGKDTYEEVCTSPNHYFIDIQFAKRANECLTIVMNSQTRRAITVRSIVREQVPAGEPRVTQEFLVGDILGGNPSGEVPGPTRDLIGYRQINVYSPNHTYEHIYVNSQRYAWQCLNGVQRGHGDMDYASYYKLEDKMYVFTFREKIIPCASVFFFDYKIGRCTGKFIGITKDGKIENTRAGSFIQRMSYNCYPTGVEPV
ncbi:MAG: MoaF C-terminal domain-containing protein [Peptococcaceae bacterium]|jgi:hypothetical protein|nr:molybdenum cofactor biosynthesis F family protein [Peptococcaceae bacterium]MDH7524952.1 MoaF C-terminal domain-containing protein [Peptococcaceae bacterium]